MTAGRKNGNGMAQEVLIVDDEADIRTLIGETLADEGFETRLAATAEDALSAVRKRRPALVLLDIWLEGSQMDGLELLEILRQDHRSLPVVMISGHGTVELAVSAIKKGAFDFIEKPFKIDHLLVVVERAIENARLRRDYEDLKLRTGGADELIGDSPPMREIIQAVEKVALTSSRVLITGPAGSGKEIVARQIHAKSPRAGGPFVVLNCANMHPDRMEAELFGIEAGSDGGRGKIGTLEEAHGGTLLLDQVSDMPLETQGKIVRVLQDQTFSRLGGQKPVEVDVRVIAATNDNLQSAMNAGRFREDLYYRLKVVPISVPPLRHRRSDIPLLAEYLMNRAAARSGLLPRELGDDAIAALQAYDWPGNVRQLENVIDWLLIMTPVDEDRPVSAAMLPPEIRGSVPAVPRWDEESEIMSLPLREAREKFEREYLLAQVTRFGGNISRTANFIGMERSALHRKLKTLGVQPTDRSDEDRDEQSFDA